MIFAQICAQDTTMQIHELEANKTENDLEMREVRTLAHLEHLQFFILAHGSRTASRTRQFVRCPVCGCPVCAVQNVESLYQEEARAVQLRAQLVELERGYREQQQVSFFHLVRCRRYSSYVNRQH
eukprot:SAG11_NODE_485_length_9035_cov_16.221352_3_plen_125_part_00